MISLERLDETLAHSSPWPCLLAEWQDEVKPQSIASIRLLFLGRLLTDDEVLSASTRYRLYTVHVNAYKCNALDPRFMPLPAPPSIVHLSVRPHNPRHASGTGSLKKGSLLRAVSFSGRANAPSNSQNAHPTMSSQPLEPVAEQSESQCCGCVVL